MISMSYYWGRVKIVLLVLYLLYLPLQSLYAGEYKHLDEVSDLNLYKKHHKFSEVPEDIHRDVDYYLNYSWKVYGRCIKVKNKELRERCKDALMDSDIEIRRATEHLID